MISLRMLQLLDLDRIYIVVRLPERHARAPERVERARARLPVAADLRRRRALGDQDPPRRAAHLVAALEGLLLADAREVRDPRLPPARLLLLPRLPDDDGRPRARHLRDRAALRRQRHHAGDDRARRAAADLGQPVHALRHVVRHGVEQRPALKGLRAGIFYRWLDQGNRGVRQGVLRAFATSSGLMPCCELSFSTDESREEARSSKSVTTSSCAPTRADRSISANDRAARDRA